MSDSPITAVVMSFLEGTGWEITVSPTGVIRARYEGVRIACDCFIQVLDDDEQVIVISVLGSVEPAFRGAVAELASRVNFLLRIGSFEIDFDDGELRHRVGIPVPSLPSEELIARAVYASVLACDEYVEAFIAVGSGTTDPADALDAIGFDVVEPDEVDDVDELDDA